MEKIIIIGNTRSDIIMAAATMSWDDGRHMKVKRVQLTYEDVINSIEAEYDDTSNPQRHGTPGKKSDGVSTHNLIYTHI